MVKEKKIKETKDLTPRIHITSLTPRTREFDYFPGMEPNNYPAKQRPIVNSMKNGTYIPSMVATEYQAEVDPKTFDLIKAEQKPHKIESLDYSAMYKKKKTGGYNRIEQVKKIFDKTDTPILPRYFHNPLQYFDHILLADGYVNSFAGTVVDTYVDFIMPKTLGPVLKLRNPDKFGNPQEQQKEIEKNQEVIEKLKAVDNFYNDDGPNAQDEYLGIPIQQKWKALITNHLTFGRDCLVFENWEHLPQFEYEGKKYENIPNVLKLIQPIDMGMVELDAYTGKLGGIYMYNSVPFISANNMIYLVNKYASPMIGSLYYGFSIMQRAIDPVRLYRRILAQNFPQFIRSSHSGMGVFLFDSTQYTEDIRNKIRTQIVTNYRAGEIGIIDYANIKDFDFKEIKITPEIEALIHLSESLIKIIIGILGMPQSLIFDEGASTRATLVGRIVSFINNQVAQLRSSIGKQIASQWYMRNFRILYKDEKEILEKFYIDVEFEEMELETAVERVERLLGEVQLNPLKDEYIGEQLKDDDYLDHIDTEKRDKQDEMNQNNPFGKMPVKPSSSFSVKDKDTGGSARVTTQKR